MKAAMPMKGRFPIRRTLQYLNRGDVVFKDSVKVMTVNYNTHGELGEGARKFVFFNIPQIQYKNPWVQIMLFKNMTPSPFLRFYLGTQWLLRSGPSSPTCLLQLISCSLPSCGPIYPHFLCCSLLMCLHFLSMSLKNSFAGVCGHSSSGRVCSILQNLKTKYSLSLDLALRHLVPLSADHSLLSGPTRCLRPCLLVLMPGTSSPLLVHE
ncbi:28S ribosomal protein S25, mitochondrial isoform X1 [Chionomys nivalis]|uniref:28S ribosomal protein S25, mitochondrial isoform X1 n=1 Tax=Chionomys nivalis TaxID=269649 RepID=UPI00259A35A6|nr:28S ribosomal protein S25, mitochondrial isoform X1 [Chionomys nivalis]